MTSDRDCLVARLCCPGFGPFGPPEVDHALAQTDVEPPVGIEPTTFSLRVRRSTD